MKNGSGRVDFGPRELVEFLKIEYGLKPPSVAPGGELREVGQANPRGEEIFAIVNFAVHLGMPGAAILEALKQP